MIERNYKKKRLGEKYRGRQVREREVEAMMFLMICFAPVLFVFWVIRQTIVIVARFLSFDIKCALVKKKNPEQYRYLKNEEARITNCGGKTFWVMHHYK